MQPIIYLDNAASTPIDPLVAEAIYKSMTNDFGNPSSIHAQGRKSKAQIEAVRKIIASKIGAQASEIIFTSGGTESNNLAIKGAVKALKIKRIISSEIEHSAVKNVLITLGQTEKLEICWLPVLEDGLICTTSLQKLLAENDCNTLVSLMHVNNELGNINDLEKIGKIVKNYPNTYFHSDTVQSIGHFLFDLSNSNIDLLTCSAHKIHGPKGVGFLYHKNNLLKSAEVIGGGQERSLRGGTENTAGIVGMGKAIELAYNHLEKNESHIKEIKSYTIEQLKSVFPDIQILSHSKQSSSTILNVLLKHQKNADLLLFNLDLKGILISGGSACTSGSLKGSYVINALNIDSSAPSIRISFSRFTNKSEIDALVNALKDI